MFDARQLYRIYLTLILILVLDLLCSFTMQSQAESSHSSACHILRKAYLYGEFICNYSIYQNLIQAQEGMLAS